MATAGGVEQQRQTSIRKTTRGEATHDLRAARPERNAPPGERREESDARERMKRILISSEADPVAATRAPARDHAAGAEAPISRQARATCQTSRLQSRKSAPHGMPNYVAPPEPPQRLKYQQK